MSTHYMLMRAFMELSMWFCVLFFFLVLSFASYSNELHILNEKTAIATKTTTTNASNEKKIERAIEYDSRTVNVMLSRSHCQLFWLIFGRFIYF